MTAKEKFQLAQDYEFGRFGKEVDLNMAQALYEQAAEMGYKLEEGSVNQVGDVGAAVFAGAETAHIANIYSKLVDGLSKLNTMRGGEKGFKGFVAEEMQAAEASVSGKVTSVLNNNGVADLEYIGKNGHKYYQQMKIGYKPGSIDYAKYKGQTLLIDKGNPYLKEFQAEGAKYGVKVVESNITNEEAKQLANWMQRETALTGAKEAVITPKMFGMHKAGLSTARTGAMYGGGFSLGTNVVDVLSGDKSVGQAAVDIGKDTAISYGAGYVVGAATSAVAGTSVGAAVGSAVSTAAGAVGSTAVGGAVIGAASTGIAAIGAAGTAATAAAVGAIGTVGSAVGAGAVAATTAVAGTAAGAAVAGGVAATAAVGAAVGAAAVAAAPVVAVGAAAGVAYKIIKKIF